MKPSQLVKQINRGRGSHTVAEDKRKYFIIFLIFWRSMSNIEDTSFFFVLYLKKLFLKYNHTLANDARIKLAG